MPITRDQRLDAYEARFVPRLTAALIRSVEPAISAYEQGATPALAAAYVTQAPVLLVLEQLHRTVAVDEAARTYDSLTEGQKAAAPASVREGWLSRARRFFTGEGRAVLSGITERTRQVVQQTLQEALTAGLGVREAATALRSSVASLSRERAVSIARTELVASANYGSLQGAISTGLKLNKRWLATLGARTRESHTLANGQTVALEGFFTVGPGQGRYPGDPLLPIGERARCRCAISYVPIE